MKNNNYVFITCITLLLLSSCASYRSSSLNNPSNGLITYPLVKKDNVVILAKEFNKEDCRKYLDRDVLAKGYQPVQLYIQNNSDTDYYFSLDRVSLSCVKPDEVAQSVHTSTVGRAVGSGVGALFVWPLAIPAIVDGVKSAEANEALDIDFAEKTAKDMTIFRHSSFNKLIFVPREYYQKTFEVTLIDLQTQSTKTFNLEATKGF